MESANAVDLTSSPPLPAPTTTRALAPRAARGRTRLLASASAPVSASSSRQNSVLSVRARSLPIQAVHERRDRQNDNAAQTVMTREHATPSNISSGKTSETRGKVKRSRQQGPSNASGAERAGEVSKKRRRVDAGTQRGAETASHRETSARLSGRMDTDPSPSAPVINQAVPHLFPGPIEMGLDSSAGAETYPRDLDSFTRMFDSLYPRNLPLPIAGPSGPSTAHSYRPSSIDTSSPRTSASNLPNANESPHVPPPRLAEVIDTTATVASSSITANTSSTVSPTQETSPALHKPLPTFDHLHPSPKAPRLPIPLPILETRSLPASPPPSPPAPAGAEPEPLHTYTCPICFCPPSNATLTPCGHILCGECLFTAVSSAVRRTGVGGLGARCLTFPASILGARLAILAEPGHLHYINTWLTSGEGRGLGTDSDSDVVMMQLTLTVAMLGAISVELSSSRCLDLICFSG
ncbi:hypothetical protein EVG20_g7214 [Dentipellis fragilis]|uniref:Zinc finger C3HC4 RING-type domain-containing protein n=1 Tax=Dentipellis fragilis TaxID=205917 RepID=A0A4Y9YFN1_9AGAM|nr:hypothetical protein EVG20_g7214 [Dentipellis fragilis]